MIKPFLYRWLLKRLLLKACESRIPRSGKKGEAVNCYVVALDRDDSPYFIATAITEDSLDGVKWDGNRYSVEDSIPFSEFENGKMNITHYYGLSEVIYENIYDAVWNYITKLVYLKIGIYRYIDSTHQYFFNKRKLVTKKRMDLLRFMLGDQIERTHNGISSLDIMKKIYSLRLFLHPSWQKQHTILKMYLDSLVDSGEIEEINNEYVVTGKAISTIEKYEEEERRHTEAVKLQRKMFWLTIVAVIFAVVQSGVIKLPTVLDLSNSVKVQNVHNKAIQPTP